jgi:hypothetical protein
MTVVIDRAENRAIRQSAAFFRTAQDGIPASTSGGGPCRDRFSALLGFVRTRLDRFQAAWSEVRRV